MALGRRGAPLLAAALIGLTACGATDSVRDAERAAADARRQAEQAATAAKEAAGRGGERARERLEKARDSAGY